MEPQFAELFVQAGFVVTLSIKRTITVAQKSDITTMLSEIKELIDPDNRIGLIESVRIVKEKTSIETRYYISSLPNDAQKFGESVRSHWGIENYLHWVLDMGFCEEDCRIRKNNAPQKLAIIRHISLNLLNQKNTSKTGAKNKRLRAGWADEYLTKILAISVN